MGSVGLTLVWEHKITGTEREGESRVDRSEAKTGVDPAAGQDPRDAAVAAACLRGELRGYELLFQWQGARMRNLARNLLGSSADAEDAVQETFLKIQRSVSGFRGQSSFLTWTFRILVNTCHDLRRSRARRKEDSETEPDDGTKRAEPRAAVAHPSLRLALESALTRLSEHQRDVFLLYEVDGFRHAEIASLLEISETASKNTLFQAKKNLRTMLDPPRNRDTGGPA
jgi:RNA polymerase sigma-70 factor (ECF subfamily)